jgi:heme-degrading monooxygenase HmoA
MIAVIFEAFPANGKWDEYLDIASVLRPELNKIPGFISVERFQSLIDPKKVLSLSFWKDEQSVAKWRNTEMHRHAQQRGRDSIFNDYRIRIAKVQRDYCMKERTQVPVDSKQIHDQKI